MDDAPLLCRSPEETRPDSFLSCSQTYWIEPAEEVLRSSAEDIDTSTSSFI
jgi:hypothetical protein